MDLEKLTDRARGFLQAAQTIAVREHNQRITPAHYLKALLDDEQGMAVGLPGARSTRWSTRSPRSPAVVRPRLRESTVI